MSLYYIYGQFCDPHHKIIFIEISLGRHSVRYSLRKATVAKRLLRAFKVTYSDPALRCELKRGGRVKEQSETLRSPRLRQWYKKNTVKS